MSSTTPQPPRARRSTLAVPGSNPRFIEKARTLDCDEVFFDLEDAVAPLVKEKARGLIISALNKGGWGRKIRAVRVNDWETEWTYRDVIEIVQGAGANLDSVILPKVRDASQVAALDLLLGQVEAANGLPRGGIAVEAQIETADGVLNLREIATASPRVQALIFGPADYMASVNMRSLAVGELHPDYPGDPFHYVLSQILLVARAGEIQAIDGPCLQVRDGDGFRTSARRTALLGFDGKWVLHPDQIAAANEIFAPTQEEYDRAELIIDAYEHSISRQGGARGAVMLGDEMLDEASRKLALAIAAKGRAAGMIRGSEFAPPDRRLSDHRPATV